jgi:hypothetical protein
LHTFLQLDTSGTTLFLANPRSARRIFGVDFTSAPNRRKPIVVATGTLLDASLHIEQIEPLCDFAAFDALLASTGPWIGGFDLPFGLPRELVETLNWPTQWQGLVMHVQSLGKNAFKDALNQVRESRPIGARYIPRRGDAAAGASSPMKLVNPPVGLMFFEGAPRIARSGASVIPCRPNADTRVALEAYPGFLARQFTKLSYKKDGPEGRTLARRSQREIILNAITTPTRVTLGLHIYLPKTLNARCIEDGSGDTLDAVLCAAQAGVAQRAFQAGDTGYGIPATADSLEGWIATVPDVHLSAHRVASLCNV